jgi:hypothetical protein
MKERRHAGATHSFRLTMKAAQIVDSMNHPRRLGGKSRKVSDAIEAYYGHYLSKDHEMPSYAELLLNISALQTKLSTLHQEFDNVSSSHEIADQETNRTSQRGGRGIISWIMGRSRI